MQWTNSIYFRVFCRVFVLLIYTDYFIQYIWVGPSCVSTSIAIADDFLWFPSSVRLTDDDEAPNQRNWEGSASARRSSSMRAECCRVSPSNALHLRYPIRIRSRTSIPIRRRHRVSLVYFLFRRVSSLCRRCVCGIASPDLVLQGLRRTGRQDRASRSRPLSIYAGSTRSLFRPVLITRFDPRFTLKNAVRKSRKWIFKSKTAAGRPRSGCCIAFCNRIGNPWGRHSGTPRTISLPD